MSDEADDVPSEHIEQFTKLLNKVMPGWDKIAKPEPKQEQTPPPAAPADLSTFLNQLLGEEKKKSATLEAKIEKLLGMLTPEQLTQLRSPPPENGAGQNLQKKSAQPAQPEKKKFAGFL